MVNSTLTTTTLEKTTHHKLRVIGAVKQKSLSEVIEYLISNNSESKKILEVTKI